MLCVYGGYVGYVFCVGDVRGSVYMVCGGSMLCVMCVWVVCVCVCTWGYVCGVWCMCVWQVCVHTV